MALYKGKNGIQWGGLQLIDVLLPALSSVETEAGIGVTTGLRWVGGDTAVAWYCALLNALGEVVIDVARLLTEQSRVQQCTSREIEIPRPALRRILRARPNICPSDNIRLNAEDLIPIRFLPRVHWDFETSLDNFMKVGSTTQVIRPDDLRPDDLAVRPREERELRDQEMADEANAEAKDRNLHEHAASEYGRDLAAIEDELSFRYDKGKAYDTLATPAFDDALTYNIGVTYSRMETQERVFMARQELTQEQVQYWSDVFPNGDARAGLHGSSGADSRTNAPNGANEKHTTKTAGPGQRSKIIGRRRCHARGSSVCNTRQGKTTQIGRGQHSEAHASKQYANHNAIL